jgi:hypothetical protein
MGHGDALADMPVYNCPLFWVWTDVKSRPDSLLRAPLFGSRVWVVAVLLSPLYTLHSMHSCRSDLMQMCRVSAEETKSGLPTPIKKDCFAGVEG